MLDYLNFLVWLNQPFHSIPQISISAPGWLYHVVAPARTISHVCWEQVYLDCRISGSGPSGWNHFQQRTWLLKVNFQCFQKMSRTIYDCSFLRLKSLPLLNANQSSRVYIRRSGSQITNLRKLAADSIITNGVMSSLGEIEKLHVPR